MAKRNLFQITSLFYLIAGLAIVTALGLFAYSNLSRIVDTVSEAGRPDLSLANIEEIQSDLFDAENSVYTYSISRDETYLDPFFAAASSADQKLNELQRLNQSTPEKARLTEILDRLIDEKYDLLTQTLEFELGDRVDEALEQVEKKVKQIRPNSLGEEKEETTTTTSNGTVTGNPSGGVETEVQGETKEKRNIFKRVFGKNPDKKEEKPKEEVEKEPKKERKKRRNKDKEEEVVEIEEEEAPDIDSLMRVSTLKMKRELRAEISRVNQEDDEKLEKAQQVQLELNAENKRVSEEIRSVAGQLEEIERAAIKARTKDAEVMAIRTNRYIIGFCIAAGLLLLLLGSGIFDYLRKNNRYQHALLKAQKAATELAATRQRFLANMSHELRTPLNAIAGFTEQVLNTPLPKPQKEQLQVVRQSSDHLLGILNSILDFSRLQSAKLTLENATFDPSRTLELVIRLMRLEAQKKDLKFVYALDQALPPALVGDELRLRQILFNLLNNAIKFTETGEVGLQITQAQPSLGRIEITFSVYDTGIGISEENQATIFQPFEQAEDSTSRRYGGTGLGLAITHQLVELHGGEIKLDSQPNEGTRITFALPYQLGKSTDLPAEPATPVAEPHSFQGKRILVVDDEPYNRLLVGALLSKWELNQDEASTGKQALEKALQNRYDAILMDLRLPDVSGLEVTRQLKSKEGPSQKAPVIALTATTGPEIEAECKAIGMNATLPKPFAEADLLAVLSKLFGGTPPPKSEEQAPEVNGLSLDPLRKLSRDNPAFLRELTETFVKTTRDNLKALQEHPTDWDQTGLLAHRMAAPARHVGAKELYQLLKQLEKEADRDQRQGVRKDLLVQIEREATRVTDFFDAELAKLN